MSLLPLLIGRRGGAGGLGPGGTKNCLVWLRTDKPHVSAPEVVALTGNNVDIWYDQSGLKNHALSSGNFRPTWTSGVTTCAPAGSLPGVMFDGVDDFLTISSLKTSMSTESLSFSNRSSAMMFVVFQGVDQSSGLLSVRHIKEGPTFTDGMNIRLFVSSARDEITFDVPCGDESFTPVTIPLQTFFSYSNGNPHLLVNIFDANAIGNNYRFRADCVFEIPLNIENTTKLLAKSNELNIGRYGPGGLYFTGYIFEILLFADASESTRIITESYLCNKWCI